MSATDDFRKELLKIMPGYKWIIHKSRNPSFTRATGIMSSGFNRLSTLEVLQETNDEGAWYRAASAGYGTKAIFGQSFGGKTIARALRDLQTHYERQAAEFQILAARLKDGRKAPKGGAT